MGKRVNPNRLEPLTTSPLTSKSLLRALSGDRQPFPTRILQQTRSSDRGQRRTRDRQRVRLNAVGQGFWSETIPNDVPRFAGSYAVGENPFPRSSQPTGRVSRNFFTFRLPTLEPGQRIIRARLRLTRMESSGDRREPLALFDVSTPARRLNNLNGTSDRIYQDLGTGQRYGNFRIRTEESPDGVLNLRLNRQAIADLNDTDQQRFSIGGRLTNMRRCDCSSAEFLFGSADTESRIELVLVIADRS